MQTETIKVATFETSVFGVKAWHCRCLTCGWESRRSGHQQRVNRLARDHRCDRVTKTNHRAESA